jgi:hypothetical protein
VQHARAQHPAHVAGARRPIALSDVRKHARAHKHMHAQQHYNLDSNAEGVRSESVEQARDLDKKTGLNKTKLK